MAGSDLYRERAQLNCNTPSSLSSLWGSKMGTSLEKSTTQHVIKKHSNHLRQFGSVEPRRACPVVRGKRQR
jgi:hypothetical protein